jgi:hypothetical protein
MPNRTTWRNLSCRKLFVIGCHCETHEYQRPSSSCRTPPAALPNRRRRDSRQRRRGSSLLGESGHDPSSGLPGLRQPSRSIVLNACREKSGQQESSEAEFPREFYDARMWVSIIAFDPFICRSRYFFLAAEADAL